MTFVLFVCTKDLLVPDSYQSLFTLYESYADSAVAQELNSNTTKFSTSQISNLSNTRSILDYMSYVEDKYNLGYMGTNFPCTLNEALYDVSR